MRSQGFEIVADSELKVICKRKKSYEIGIEEQKILEKWRNIWEKGDIAYNPNFSSGDGKFTFLKE